MLIGLVGVERRTTTTTLVDCTVAKAGGQLDPASASPINFSVVFSSAVSGFDSGAVNYTGSTAGGTFSAAVSGSGTTYNVAVTGMTTSGDVAITINPGYVTPPNSVSTSADNTVAWLGAGGGWQTLYTQTLTTSSDGWDSYTMREVIYPYNYSAGAPATASAIRVTLNASATSGLNADHVRVGHGAATGDAYDYDGTQVPVLFSGGTDCIIVAGGLLLSDSASYSFNKTKNLVVSVHIVSGGILTVSGLAFEECLGGYKNTGTFDDTVTTDATGYTTVEGRLYAVSKVEVFTSTGPTLQALSGTRYAEADAFGASTVTLAATQALTATRYAETDTFAAHTITTTGATQNLTVTRYTGDDAFVTHTVSPGAVGLTATRYAEADAFGASVVMNTQILTAARYTGDDAFAAATVTGATGAWYTLYNQTLSTDSAGWTGYDMREVISTSAYGGTVPSSCTKIRITIVAASTTGINSDHIYVGHPASSGDVYDFDGTQIAVTFSSGTTATVAAGGTLLSDEMTYAFNKTKNLVLAIHFAATGADSDIKRADPGTGYNGGYKPTGSAWEAGTTDVSSDYAMTSGRLYAFSKVEVFG